MRTYSGTIFTNFMKPQPFVLRRADDAAIEAWAMNYMLNFPSTTAISIDRHERRGGLRNVGYYQRQKSLIDAIEAWDYTDA